MQSLRTELTQLQTEISALDAALGKAPRAGRDQAGADRSSAERGRGSVDRDRGSVERERERSRSSAEMEPGERAGSEERQAKLDRRAQEDRLHELLRKKRGLGARLDKARGSVRRPCDCCAWPGHGCLSGYGSRQHLHPSCCLCVVGACLPAHYVPETACWGRCASQV